MNNLHHFVHCFQHFEVSDDLLPSANLQILLDRLDDGLQNAFVAFNQAARFDSLKTNRQTCRRNPLSGGIFTSAFLLLYLFQWETGVGGFVPAGFDLSSLSTRLLFPARPFDSGKAGLKNQIEKVNSIMKSIRKGYSRPLITHSIRKFPTLGGAYHHALRLTAANKQCRFALEQTQSGAWTVARIVSGGAA
ncbi:MAG: hypothetical protein D8H97_24190 [Neisseria sp.]|nr:MAG: hypothetical protein D8H97_24190 [Neisseria sp.]